MATRLRGKSLRRAREIILELFGPDCHWCGVPTVPAFNLEDLTAPHLRTVDHIKPMRWGGSNSVANLVISCYACNQRRGSSGSGLWLTQGETDARSQIISAAGYSLYRDHNRRAAQADPRQDAVDSAQSR